MIELPRTVRVGAYDVTVEFKDNLTLDEESPGFFNSRDMNIQLDPAFGDGPIRGIFIHEVVEAIVNIYGLDGLKDDHEELSRLAEGLHQVLRDNKELYP